MTSLGEYIDERLKESDRHKADAERLAGEVRELKEQVKRLQDSARIVRIQCDQLREYYHVALTALERVQATLKAERAAHSVVERMR